MSIQVHFFASLRERFGQSDLSVSLPSDATVAGVWRQVVGIDSAIPANLLAAVNHEYAELATRVNDGDEVAFFPPVTGG